MLAEMGDDSFKLGNVHEDTYKDLMKCDCTKAMCRENVCLIALAVYICHIVEHVLL